MATWWLQKGGVDVTVKLKSADAESLLNSVFEVMGAEPSSRSKGAVLHVAGSAGAWQLKDKSTKIDRILKLDGDLIYHLTDRLIFHIANSVQEAHCVHAAAVSFEGGALVVPAKSGAGKSTFTSWLVANGFDYVTDELIVIDEASHVQGVARPIQIKSNGLDAIRALLKSSEYHQGSIATAIPIAALGGQVADDVDRLAAFVFPSYTRDAEFEFKQLSSAEAGLQLMNNHVNARNLPDHGFRAMMQLIRKTPCYSLQYGGFDTLPTHFVTTLQQLCAPAS